MKQTAVEWLWLNLTDDIIGDLSPQQIHSIYKLVEQAKQMEKEIIRTAYLDGMDGEYNTSEQYYNETFKSE
jgi:hypothetical protein